MEAERFVAPESHEQAVGVEPVQTPSLGEVLGGPGTVLRVADEGGVVDLQERLVVLARTVGPDRHALGQRQLLGHARGITDHVGKLALDVEAHLEGKGLPGFLDPVDPQEHPAATGTGHQPSGRLEQRGLHPLVAMLGVDDHLHGQAGVVRAGIPAEVDVAD